MYALALIPLVTFWAALAIAFRRPGHNYVGEPPSPGVIWARLMTRALNSQTVPAMKAIGEAFKEALPGMQRFALALKGLDVDADAVRREWEL